MTNIDWNNPNLDDILGIPDIDKHEGFFFAGQIESILGKKNIAQVIREFETQHDIRIEVQDGGRGVYIYDTTGDEIGHIKRGNYSYNGLESEDHIDIVVDPYYRQKGIGKLLLEVFVKSDGNLPNTELSHKKSKIGLLTKYAGYQIIGKYIAGEYIPLELGEEDEVYNSQIDELDSTYLLKKVF